MTESAKDATKSEPCANCGDGVLPFSTEALPDDAPEVQAFREGTWYQNEVSGAWFRNEQAAGDISVIVVSGIMFTKGTLLPKFLALEKGTYLVRKKFAEGEDSWDFVWIGPDAGHEDVEVHSLTLEESVEEILKRQTP